MTFDQLRELLALPDAHARVSEGRPRMILVEAGESETEAIAPVLLERCRSLPAVIVAVGGGHEDGVVPRGAPSPPWADVVITSSADPLLAKVARTLRHSPLAATALVLLLRSSERMDTASGLVAESAVYSMLQAGPEFAAWRSDTPRRTTRPGRVEVERHGSLLEIVLDRPDVHNALDTPMIDSLIDALQLAAFDPSIERIDLSGRGPSFCSGGDLDEFGRRPDPATAHLIRLTRSAGRLLAELSDRTTVRLHGSTRGSGLELAAFAGHVVAAEYATLALPEVRLGLIPGAGGTVSLVRRIGRHRTALLALSGEAISAATARTWGLVDEVTIDDSTGA